MSLEPGSCIGRYEIAGRIGAGGMGEVYRATDTDLKRLVAIKVLPDALAADPDRLARFRREAEILASLNHPNIAQIFGLERQDGPEGRIALVAMAMELVAGTDLADEIARGPIPVGDAVRIARQIADALDAAHQAGIVHRDLKPSNVRIRPDRTIKVFDFGLAKGQESPRESDGTHESAAMTRAATEAGTVLGTVAYMSPEQARGRSVDKRTDIWAFGCVLYEMLTGHSAFGGETASDSIAAILERDPDWSALPSATPPSVRRLISWCVAKDRQQRLRDIGDARLQLDEALMPSGTEPASASAKGRARTTLWLPLAAAVVAALAAWIVRGQLISTPSATAPSAHFSIGAPAGYQLDFTRSGVAVSPDGRTVAFAASRGNIRRIYLRDIDNVEATALPGIDDGVAPFFSPDGKWVGFFANQKIRKVLRSGGSPVTIVDVAAAAGNKYIAANWATPDTIFFTPDMTKGIWRVSSDGGKPTQVTAPTEGERFHYWPQLLPGEKAILFSAAGDGPEPSAYVQRLDTGERKALLHGLETRYVQDGRLVFVHGGSLMAVPFDSSRLEITGSPVDVVSNLAEPLGLRTMPSVLFTPLFDLSSTGTLALLSADRQPRHALVWVDRSGREQEIGASGGTYFQPRISPDGRRIAVVIRGTDHDDVWFYDVMRNTWDRFTSEGNNAFPVWRPDGSGLAYNSDRSGPVSIDGKRLDGATSETLVPAERAKIWFPFSWSPEGALAYVSMTPTQDLWVLPAGAKPKPFLNSPSVEGSPMFSPDGRAIAYVSDESGRNEVYLRPYPEPGEKVTVTNDGGNEPVWAANGRELFYRNGDAMMAVDVTTTPQLRTGAPHRLFEKHYEQSAALYANYSVTADGQRFVMIKRIDEGDLPTQINVFTNWFDELNRKLAVK